MANPIAALGRSRCEPAPPAPEQSLLVVPAGLGLTIAGAFVGEGKITVIQAQPVGALPR